MYLAYTIFYILAQSTSEGTDNSKGLITNLLIIPIMMVFLYFFVIRPNRKEEEKRKNMIASLNKGDTVVTTSGIHGKIVEFKDNNESVILNIAKDTNVTFQTSAIILKKANS